MQPKRVDFRQVRGRVSLPQEVQKLYLLIGLCRSNTTPLSYLFALLGMLAYMQPLKSIARALEEAGKLPYWRIKYSRVNGSQMAISKETIGLQTLGEYLNFLREMLELGYPKEMLNLILTVRRPDDVLSSWLKVWGDEKVAVSNLLEAYRLLLEIINLADREQIPVSIMVYESLRDFDPKLVIQLLFGHLGLGQIYDPQILQPIPDIDFRTHPQVVFF